MAGLAQIWFRLFWNRRAMIAVMFAAPAILTAIGSFLMSRSIGGEIVSLEAALKGYDSRAAQLERVTGEVEQLQLDRATVLLVLTGKTATRACAMWRTSSTAPMRNARCAG